MKPVTLLSLIFSLALFQYSCTSFEDKTFSFEREDRVVNVTDGKTTIRVAVITGDIVRVDYLEGSVTDFKRDTSWFVTKKSVNARFRIRQTGEELLVHTNRLVVEVTKEPFAAHFLDTEGNPLLTSTRRVQFDSITTRAWFEATPGDRFYGMGQKSINVNRRGYSFRSCNQHVQGYMHPSATMQVNIPYVYSPRGWGVLFDNPWTGYFDMAQANPDEWFYRTDGGEFSFYVVHRDTPQGLLRGYYDLTGYVPMFPKWTLGLLQGTCATEKDSRVCRTISGYREKDLPLDAIILDANYFGGYKKGIPGNSLNFSRMYECLPDSRHCLDTLNTLEIKTITNNDPFINLASESYEYLEEKGWLVSRNDHSDPHIFSPFPAESTSLLDITHPEAQDWLWSRLKKSVSKGVDGLSIGPGEPEQPIPDIRFHMGPAKKVNNLYSHIFARVIWEGYQTDFPDKRVFHLTRSATAGTQRYGTMAWSGNASKTWNALKLQVPMLIGTATSGMPHFASGIGGFSNANERRDGEPILTSFDRQGLTNPELYTRWFQFGTFSPALISQCADKQRLESLAIDEQTERITSRYLEYRYRLVPFLYSYMYKTAMTGEGLIRPMFLMFEQQEAHGKDYQYMFGKEMLVAPVLEEGAREVEVWLPELENNRGWIDLHSGKKFEGGQTLEVSAPLDEIPVFVHQPSLFPLGKVKPHIEASPDDTLTLMVYPGGKAIFDLYEDDGTSNDYRKGKFAVTSLRTTTNSDELRIRINAANGQFGQLLQKRYWIIKVHLLSDFNQLLLNNKEVTKDHYSYDEETQILTFSTWYPVKETLKLTITNPSIR